MVVVVAGAVVVVVAAAVVVEPGGKAAQVGRVIALSSRVTAPVRANRRPITSVPVFAVIEAEAMTVPTKRVPVPGVADELTCQKMLQGLAEPMRTTELLLAVIKVELVLKRKTASGSPPASIVIVPVS